ncbi:hypothetical protein GH714_002072 [Hevea brasiliensis]|uniref:Uncharacterized protein n=1 Tax=Hevea brasiliensis TaxID=3981 RepID=A0A6A6KFF6_HEVBR|nr:hypothetical protein GH714_002072 [Hevea brasiliensis]
MGGNAISTKDYTLLKDFRMEIELKGGNFSFSFWVYIIDSTTAFPATIISQVYSDITSSAPFIALDENKSMTLLPLSLLCKEAPDPTSSTLLTETSHASMKNEFPLENWVHVGCGVFTDVFRLHINGEIVGECSLSSSFNKDSISNGFRKITLVGASGVMDPPLQLSIDDSSTSDIEEGIDGIWSIVGGKASCRRIFSLDVVLSNAISQAIDKEVEVVASLLYADNGLPVEKTSDDEAPL